MYFFKLKSEAIVTLPQIADRFGILAVNYRTTDVQGIIVKVLGSEGDLMYKAGRSFCSRMQF
jgi:hypothetical protein